uniref:Ribosomal protein S14 n=1 Tax=Chroomonas placoidea TaxID=173977 RepID=A0A2P1G856_9CRYP|nr:ribosomal protein S14 [Chroomonas placoidea]AVM81129.1 ribosomal protein S14 [Chroomonas placoidea]
MKYKILIDNKRRLLFKKNELKYISIKVGIRLNQKLKINSFLKPLTKNNTFSKIKNRCFITSRSKGLYKRLKVSRIKFREMALTGNYPGFTKNCW